MSESINLILNNDVREYFSCNKESEPVLCWCTRASVVGNLVREIRGEIERVTSLTASAGTSPDPYYYL